MSYGSFHLPTNQLKTEVFYQSTTWTIPQGATMLHIVCIGAGGGGGAGLTGVSGAARGGGAGGGSGAISTLLIKRMFLPDALNIVIAPGAAGSPSSGSGGSSANPTYVQTTNTTASFVVIPTDIVSILVRAAGGLGGNPGTGAGTATGGGGGPASTSLVQTLDKVGVSSTLIGQTGGAGGTAAGAVGTTIVYGAAGIPISSGAGGAGINTVVQSSFVGGNITGAGFVPTNLGGTAITISGNTGIHLLTPFASVGGSGGAAFDSAVGGRGGDGNIGCGGGGGGGGTTGGAGGRGGNGLVIINYW
jgi:hypothetical protein